jgi:hypothetical protein
MLRLVSDHIEENLKADLNCVRRQNNSHSFSHLTMCGFGRILACKEINHESRAEPFPIREGGPRN